MIEEQIDHQSDNFTGREMLPGRLIGLLRKPGDELLKDTAHLQVRDCVRVQINLAEAGKDHVKQVRLIKPADLLLEAEMLQDLSGPRREPVDVTRKVGGNIVGLI